MGQETSPTSFEQFSDGVMAGTERLLQEITTDVSDETLSSTAKELLDVVQEVDDLLGTIDFEKLPDAVEASALPDLIEPDQLPAAIREKDPDRALDLSTIRHAITPGELWNTVDLVDFQKELRQLKTELADVVGPDVLESSGDSEVAADAAKFVDEVKPEATNAALQQKAQSAAEAARGGVIDGHSKFEELYESTQRGPGYAGRRPVSKNPTAVSSVPHGPLPASASTRVSTVPANVRGSKIDALPRIYGRRWRTAAADR
ncbi:hypothetical protein [Halosolutus gelatinilyticus]|uniref:hypothetical protein n=1 Tax=Halosolutus gelatinilyticus TaxID=2931975 RepID=UPI001FF4DC54|nr:hypothetical protein [Halosolutus gelatinilyticus]